MLTQPTGPYLIGGHQQIHALVVQVWQNAAVQKTKQCLDRLGLKIWDWHHTGLGLFGVFVVKHGGEHR